MLIVELKNLATSISSIIRRAKRRRDPSYGVSDEGERSRLRREEARAGGSRKRVDTIQVEQAVLEDGRITTRTVVVPDQDARDRVIAENRALQRRVAESQLRTGEGVVDEGVDARLVRVSPGVNIPVSVRKAREVLSVVQRNREREEEADRVLLETSRGDVVASRGFANLASRRFQELEAARERDRRERVSRAILSGEGFVNEGYLAEQVRLSRLSDSDFLTEQAISSVERGKRRAQSSLLVAELLPLTPESAVSRARAVGSAVLGVGQIGFGIGQGVVGSLYDPVVRAEAQSIRIGSSPRFVTREDVEAGLVVGSLALPVTGLQGRIAPAFFERQKPFFGDSVIALEGSWVPYRARTIRVAADQPAAVISPYTRQFLARFPTGEVVDGVPIVQETLSLRAGRNVRRVSPSEALRIPSEEQITRLDEARNILIFAEPIDVAAGENVGITESFRTPFGDLVTNRPFLQTGLGDFPRPVRTTFGTVEYAGLTGRESVFDILVGSGQRMTQQQVSHSVPGIPIPSFVESEGVVSPIVSEFSASRLRFVPLLSPGSVGVGRDILFVDEGRDNIPSISSRVLLFPDQGDVLRDRVVSVIDAGQISSPLVRLDVSQSQRQRQRILSSQIFDESLVEVSDSGVLQRQVPIQSSIQGLGSELVSEEVVRSGVRQSFFGRGFTSDFGFRVRRDEPRIPVVGVPSLRFTALSEPLFRVFVGRQGQEFAAEFSGGVDALQNAVNKVRRDASASLRVEALNVEAGRFDVKRFLGSEFRPSRSEPGRFVERDEFRIDAPEEFSQISLRGSLVSSQKDIVSASGKRYDTPLRSDSSMLLAKGIVDSGTPLREARRRLKEGFF